MENNSSNGLMTSFWVAIGGIAIHIYCYMQVAFYLWDRMQPDHFFAYVFFATAWAMIGETVSLIAFGVIIGIYHLFTQNRIE